MTALRSERRVLNELCLNSVATNPRGVLSRAAIAIREAPNVAVPDASEIAKFIVHEMVQNTDLKNPDFTTCKDKLEHFRKLLAKDGPAHPIYGPLEDGEVYVAAFDALTEFARMVKEGGDWDHKRSIRLCFGRESLLDGVKIVFDVWSNIHYGFVGTAIGYSSWELRAAAGLYQAWMGRVPDGWIKRWLRSSDDLLGALDDPRDQTSIRIGIQLATASGRAKVSHSDLLAAVKVNLSSLASKD